MPLFKKKPPPQWFVMRAKKYTSSTSEPTREGPYTRATITQMYGEGLLGDGALIWTNEKIFPNAQKPSSMRSVRIMEWRRLDQLPDPVVRQLAADWQLLQTQQSNPSEQTGHNPQTSQSPASEEAAESSDSMPPTSPPPPPPPGGPSGGTPVAQPQYPNSGLSSIYPAPVHQPAPQQNAPMNHSQMGAFPQSGAYPAPSAPPPPPSGHPTGAY